MAAMAPTPAASWPMYRWQKPPIFFRPYICAAFSSNLRIRSIFPRRSFSRRADARSLFWSPIRAPSSETDDFLPALHRQEVRRLFYDCFQDNQVTRVVRELPESAQPGAEHLQDFRAQGGVLHQVDGPPDADDLIQRRRLEHPFHPRVLAHLYDFGESRRRDGIDGPRTIAKEGRCKPAQVRSAVLVRRGEQARPVGFDNSPDPVHHLAAVHASKIE